MDLINEWMARWLAKSLSGHLLAACLGVCGMCIYLAIFPSRKLLLPRYRRRNHSIELNLAAYFIVGMGAAVLADWSMLIELVAGVMAVPIMQGTIKEAPRMILRAVLSWLPSNREGER